MDNKLEFVKRGFEELEKEFDKIIASHYKTSDCLVDLIKVEDCDSKEIKLDEKVD